jgi:hypothetical protein
MGHVEHGEVVDEHDRPLTPREKHLVAKGEELPVGNGSYVPFSALPPETLRQYQAKAVETRRLNREAKRLAERAAYIEKHKEHAATILGGRVAVMEGLLAELVDPETGKPDTRRMSEKRLTLLQNILNDFDKAMDMTPVKAEAKSTLDVNVTHTVSKIIERLGEG